MTGLRTESANGGLVVDAVTQGHLELFRSLRDGGRTGTLLSVVDRTGTSFGARALRRVLEQPLGSVEEIEERLDAVEELVNGPARLDAVAAALSRLPDLPRLLSRVAVGSATPREAWRCSERGSSRRRPLARSWKARSRLSCGPRGARVPLGRAGRALGPARGDARRDPARLREGGGIVRDGADPEPWTSSDAPPGRGDAPRRPRGRGTDAAGDPDAPSQVQSGLRPRLPRSPARRGQESISNMPRNNQLFLLSFYFGWFYPDGIRCIEKQYS